MTVKLILLLLITSFFVSRASTDYAYDDYEEIPDSSPSTTEKTISTTSHILLTNEFGEEIKTENDIDPIKDQLEVMSNTFRKTINKIKTKHKKIEMVFLVDSSSSVGKFGGSEMNIIKSFKILIFTEPQGKDNFVNEINFVKRLLSDFNVSFNYTRVALITFSSRSKIVSDSFDTNLDLA